MYSWSVSKIIHGIFKVVRSIRTVRSFGTENNESNRYKVVKCIDYFIDSTSQELTLSTANLSWITGRNRGREESISMMAIYISILSVFWFGGKEVAKGKLSSALLFSFIGYCFNLNFGIQVFLSQERQIESKWIFLRAWTSHTQTLYALPSPWNASLEIL